MNKKTILSFKNLVVISIFVFLLILLSWCSKPENKIKDYTVETVSWSNITWEIDLFKKKEWDKCIDDAQKMAIENFDIFEEAFNSKRTDLYKDFVVKWPFSDWKDKEHMWVDVRKINTDSVEWILINKPYYLKNYKLWDYTKIYKTQIEDRYFINISKDEYIWDYSYHCFYWE